MSLESIRVIGTGSHAVIVKNLNMSHKTPQWEMTHPPAGGKPVYKISTNGASNSREIKNAKYLSQLDPKQKFFVYPIKSYVVTADPKMLEFVDERNLVPQKTFNRHATRMFIDVMPYAGISLKRLNKDGMKLTAKQARTIILSLMNGLIELHKRGICHGDAHEHNVVVDIRSNGDMIARWIDFSEMKMRDDLQGDVKRFIGVIRLILTMVAPEEHDDHLEAMYTAISRGVAPMSASSLRMDISKFLTPPPVKRKRSSSSTTNKSRSSTEHVKKTLKF